MPEIDPTEEVTMQDLSNQLAHTTKLLETMIAFQKNWKYPIRNGLLAGLASLIGVALVVSLLVHVLKPFSSLDSIRQDLEHLTHSSGGHNGNNQTNSD